MSGLRGLPLVALALGVGLFAGTARADWRGGVDFEIIRPPAPVDVPALLDADGDLEPVIDEVLLLGPDEAEDIAPADGIVVTRGARIPADGGGPAIVGSIAPRQPTERIAVSLPVPRPAIEPIKKTAPVDYGGL